MKKRYVLRFSPEVVNRPIVSDIIKAFNISVNIMNADISSGRAGMLVVELDGSEEALEHSVEYLQRHGVECSPHVKELVFDQEKCVDCGSCTSVCFSGALVMNRESWELEYHADSCVVCGLCVEACPLRLFTITRGAAS
jgi:L-aspartate semialdehyde sulfurtransferase ferredoxin